MTTWLENEGSTIQTKKYKKDTKINKTWPKKHQVNYMFLFIELAPYTELT
jgi:hypothetical protein